MQQRVSMSPSLCLTDLKTSGDMLSNRILLCHSWSLGLDGVTRPPGGCTTRTRKLRWFSCRYLLWRQLIHVYIWVKYSWVRVTAAETVPRRCGFPAALGQHSFLIGESTPMAIFSHFVIAELIDVLAQKLPSCLSPQPYTTAVCKVHISSIWTLAVCGPDNVLSVWMAFLHRRLQFWHTLRRCSSGPSAPHVRIIHK